MTLPDLDSLDPGYDLPPPSDAQLRGIAERLGFELSEATLATMSERVRASVRALKALRALEPVEPPTRHPRLAGRAPHNDENPYNAWSWRCDVRGQEEGALTGTSIAVKESVCVAGTPMSNGSALFEGHVPTFDATVVGRVLDAGARISGKANSENLGLSSGSNTSSRGPVLNPADPERSTGGSSSGCAALVAAGACDASIGTDQGGSVRIPASLCGLVGLKPTFGRVPYTGIISIESSIDHVGFLARDVDTVEAMLDSTDGPDGLDPRWQMPAGQDRSNSEPSGGPWRVALVEEGIELLRDPGAAGERMGLVSEALRSAGCVVESVSVPEHSLASLVATPIYAEGICTQLFHSGGTSMGWKGFYPESESVSMLRGIRTQPDLIPDTGKMFAMLGEHLRSVHLGRYYARAQNIAVGLVGAYDEKLSDYDALLMPTCAPEPVALPLPTDPTPDDVFDAAFGYHANAAPFNLTGHPALSVPAGELHGVPFGVMFVGTHRDDHTLLRIAAMVERYAHVWGATE